MKTLIATALLTVAGVAAAQTMQPTPANPNPPRCSRTVTDNCVQSSANERDEPRAARMGDGGGMARQHGKRHRGMRHSRRAADAMGTNDAAMAPTTAPATDMSAPAPRGHDASAPVGFDSAGGAGAPRRP